MNANKTQPSSSSVADYLQGKRNEGLKAEASKLNILMTEITGVNPVMWGTSIVGYGSHHYVYSSGREGSYVAVGFAVRTKALVIYGLSPDAIADPKLGKVTHGKGCLYIASLNDVDLAILGAFVKEAFVRNNNQDY